MLVLLSVLAATATTAEASCSPWPTACAAQATVGKAKLLIRDRAPKPSGNKIIWKWKGSELAVADLGNPEQSGGTEYRLCAWRKGASSGAALALDAAVPAGPGWSRKLSSNNAVSLTYRATETDSPPAGVRAVQIKNAANGKARVKVDLQGPNVALPSLPVPSPENLVVQLTNTAGGCWEALYDARAAPPPSSAETTLSVSSPSMESTRVRSAQCATPARN